MASSTWYGGRLATTDAYAEGPIPRPEQRDGVGIDRFTGGAADKAKFQLEVITEGTFVTSLHIRNFELWQLGLVAFVLQDLRDGLIRLGMGKSRGLGKVVGEVRSVRLDFLGPGAPAPAGGQITLKGIGEMMEEATARDYRTVRPDALTVPFAGEWNGGPGQVRSTARFPAESFPWADLGRRWVEYIQSYEPAPKMRLERFAQGGKE